MIGISRRAACAGLASFACGVLARPAAARNPAAELGPATAAAALVGPFLGRLSASPENGPVGTPIRVQGRDLPVNQELQLVWRTVVGRWKVADGEYRGRSYDPVGYEIARVRTDATGAFEATFAAPEDFGFAHDIVVQQGSRLLNQTAFSIDMQVKVTPDSGPVGTPIHVEVTGLGWRQLQNSWLLLYDNAFTGWISSVTTGGTANFDIPATGAPGRHVLEVLHGDFTFPYRNMQQSPEPDRPRFAVDFTIVEGLALLPPPPSRQAQTAVRRLPSPGAIRVAPPFATVGQSVEAVAEGLIPGTEYSLNWTTVTGNRVAAGGWEERQRPIATARAGLDRSARFKFKAPDDLGGRHRLTIEDHVRKLEGSLWIAPSAINMEPAVGKVGDVIRIELKGVGWTETANIYAIVYDNAYIGYACGFNSQGDVEIFLRATGTPGWHFIDLYPAIYKGRESRPLNFRVPQLTYAEDHPGEDLPRFRFAFEVKR